MLSRIITIKAVFVLFRVFPMCSPSKVILTLVHWQEFAVNSGRGMHDSMRMGDWPDEQSEASQSGG